MERVTTRPRSVNFAGVYNAPSVRKGKARRLCPIDAVLGAFPAKRYAAAKDVTIIIIGPSIAPFPDARRARIKDRVRHVYGRICVEIHESRSQSAASV